MAAIHIPDRWFRQPIGRAELDLENPLTRGLAYAIVHGEQGICDSVRDRFADSGVAVMSASPAGGGLRYTEFATFASPSALTTSNGAYTGDFTLLSLSAPPAVANRDALVSNASNGGDQCYLFANTSSSYSPESGTLSFGGFPMGWVTSAGRIDGKPHVFVGIRQGSAGYLDRDGVEIATATVGAGAIGSSAAKLAVGGIYGYTGYTNPDTPHHLTIAWNRALSKAERIMIAQDPWQIFRAAPDVLYSLPSGVLTLNSLTMSNFTSSGARATLSITR